QHKAYLKDKHSNPSKNTDHPTPEPTVKETVKRPILKSREVQRWSGQTEIESNDLTIDGLNIQQTITTPTNMSHDIANKLFLTPFEIVESETQVEAPEKIEAAGDAVNLVQIPTCPKCNGEMIKRVAKIGARHGQSFYGCCQFPKCRGVVNISAP
ncbi:MAG: topoisomerase DNA-binding C4 zinc finger domain-containing protein, partial [Psychrobacter alimentarius]